MTPEEQTFLNELHKRIVGAVETGFSSVLSQQQRQRSAAGSSNNQTQMSRATNSLDNLNTATTKVTKTFFQLQRTLVAVNNNFRNLSGSLTSSALPSPSPSPSPTPPPPPPPPPPPSPINLGPNVAELEHRRDELLGSLGLSEWTFLGKATKKLGLNFGILAGATTTLYHAISNIAAPIAEDFFKLSARGIDASSQLFSLSKNAALAGMSLTEYVAMVDDAAHVVVRYNSFEEFNNRLETSSKSLRALGVFGPTARQLSSQMMISATSLGLPQAQFQGVMDQQITLFKQLRASTLMLPEAFGELLKTVSANENVQQELQGLAPKERAARYMQLVQLSALGSKMGLAAEQAKELASTMLAQRKASVEERFKAAGSVRMAAGMAGLGAGEAEELARFAQVKNVSSLSAEQQQRYVELAGRMEHGLQAMMNTGQIGSEYIAEQLQAMQPAALRQMLETTGKAKATVESGDVKNTKEFGKEVGKFGQAVGNFMETVSGLNKSRLWGILENSTSMMLDFAMLWKLGGISRQLSALATGGGAASGGIMSTIGNIISGGFASLKTIGIRGVLGKLGLIGVVVNFLYDAIGEFFSGAIKSAFDPSGTGGFFSKINNAIYAGFSGIVTSITGIIDWIFGTNLTIKVEETFAKLRGLWAELTSKSFAWVADMMPDWMPGKESLQNWGKDFKQSSEAAYDVAGKLARGEAKSIAEIGKKNQEQAETSATESAKVAADTAKAASESAVKAKEAADETRKAIRATSDVTTDVAGLAPAARSTFALASSTVSAGSSIAAPAPTPGPTPVNTTPVSSVSAGETSVGSSDSVTGVLTQSLAVQKQMVELLKAVGQKEPMVVTTVNKNEPQTRVSSLADNVALAQGIMRG